jgi:hypothetical protein
MAYMASDGQGPYPNKAGEFCGNYYPAGTIEEMEARGFVGLYLKKTALLNQGQLRLRLLKN